MFTSPNDDMKLFADNLWEYFRPMLMERLEHNIGWFRAVVTANPGGGKLTIQRPFDEPFTVKCVSSMSGAQVGTNVLVFTFGENLGTNAVVMGDADAHNIGGGGGGGSITAIPVGQGEYEEPLIQIANGGTGARTGTEALQNLGSSEAVWECKNLLPTMGISRTISGVTFTVNSDGSVLVNGTASALTFFGWQFSIKKGDYVLNGAPTGGQLTIRDVGGGSNPQYFSGHLDDFGNGASFSVSQDTTASINIRVASGTTLSNAVFKPMIRDASITNADYVPYAMTNRQLTEMSADCGTIYSAAWTANSSSSTNVAVSGTIDLPAGTYIITAHCPTVNVTNWAFAINDSNASATAALDDKFHVAVVSYVELVLLHKFTSPAKIRILSAASVSATFSNLTRGGLYAMRIK